MVSVSTRTAAPTGSPSAAPTAYNPVYMAEGLVVGGLVLVVLMVCVLQVGDSPSLLTITLTNPYLAFNPTLPRF